MAYETNFEYVLIFESDVIFYENFTERLTKIFTEYKNLNIPNSMIFLGDGYLKDKKLDNQVSESLFEINTTRCTDSMLFTRYTIKNFYNLMEEIIIDNPVDFLWNNFYEKLNIKSLWIETALVTQGSANGTYHSNVRN